MPCGPQIVGRVPPPAARTDARAPRFIAGKPCLGKGRVSPSEQDRVRSRALVRWLAWAVFALLAATAVITTL